MSTETAEAAEATRMSNVELGTLIGLSHSSASRVRAGLRAPGYRVMLAIEKHFGWTLQDQVAAYDTQGGPAFAAELERRVAAYVPPSESQDSPAVPPAG